MHMQQWALEVAGTLIWLQETDSVMLHVRVGLAMGEPRLFVGMNVVGTEKIQRQEVG